LIFALSLVFIIVTVILTANDSRLDSTLAAVLVYLAIPVFYITIVLFNYLRFALFKLVRWLLFVAAGLLAILGILFLLIGPFQNVSANQGLLESGTSAWQCFVVGTGLGSMITAAILYFDFEKLGYKPENAERRDWKGNLIFYSIVYLGGFLGGGLLMLLVKLLKIDFLIFVPFVGLPLFTLGSVFKSIKEYGLPLGSSKEWDDSRGKSSYTAPTPTIDHGEEPDPAEIRALCERMYYEAQGCECSVSFARVDRVGECDYKIELTFQYRNTSHMTDESYLDPSIQMHCRDQVVSKIRSALDDTGVGYEIREA
ncbi:MAG: hypothetical protein J6328_03270, partial [Bacilli bacterium]|nr:hypothetical protein [Bacilli bacterium]